MQVLDWLRLSEMSVNETFSMCPSLRLECECVSPPHDRQCYLLSESVAVGWGGWWRWWWWGESKPKHTPYTDATPHPPQPPSGGVKMYRQGRKEGGSGTQNNNGLISIFFFPLPFPKYNSIFIIKR